MHVFVSGDVQGVGFRWYCREQAMGRDLRGWVKNLPDRQVEAVFEGASDAVDALVEWCRHGPTGARVEGVEVKDESPKGEQGFRITR